VQTLRRFGVPFTVARTRWMLGLKRRFVILRDHGRLLPKPGFLAQMSQTAATVHSDQFDLNSSCARSNRYRSASNLVRLADASLCNEIEGERHAGHIG
jgi:hypothetical protein